MYTKLNTATRTRRVLSIFQHLEYYKDTVVCSECEEHIIDEKIARCGHLFTRLAERVRKGQVH